MALSEYDSERFPFHIPSEKEVFKTLIEDDLLETKRESLTETLLKVSGSIVAIERGKSLILADTSDPENLDGGEFINKNECGIIFRTQHDTVTASLYLLIVEVSEDNVVSIASIKTIEKGLALDSYPL